MATLPPEETQEETQKINLNEEFLNLSEEDNKLINLLKDEFNEMKIFNYGGIIYLHNSEEISNFLHISELFENYEKIMSKSCYSSDLVFNNTKCKQLIIHKLVNNFINYIIDYITHNDGFVINADDGIDNLFFCFKIKHLIIFYILSYKENTQGNINYRILKILHRVKYI